MSNNSTPTKLGVLRDFMSLNNIDAFIIPSTDPHLSEYPAPHWQTRVWVSGFTGSAGTVVVTQNKAALWTDSRYFIQATQQLENSTIDLQKDGLANTPSITEWLALELDKDNTVGIDAGVYAAKSAIALEHELRKKGLKLKTDKNPFDTIWKDKPIIPTNPIFNLPLKYTGESANSKIKRVCSVLEKENADSLLVTSLDTIAWLFNIRGNDVKCNPVAVAFAYISKKESVLFINPKKLTAEINAYLKAEGVMLAEYDKFYDYVAKLNETICLESAKVTLRLLNTISPKCPIIDILSPADCMKSCKNDVEIKGFKKAMLKDGVALVQFLMWIDENVGKNTVCEIDIPQKLIEYRSKQDLFVGESFDTIAGYGPHGAIVHYSVTKESSIPIKPEGLLLVDSGAQYFDGTTDITRTIAVGALSEQMKLDYTLVLKGHIAIATAIYPEGTRGSQLDILARRSLWNRGLNYLHGTGHGIGHFLNVHEGPQSIRMNENSTTLQIGMVTSNEPGLYRDGKHGVRLENLVVTRKEMSTEFGDFYSFETLTLCPFDTKPIKKEILTQSEINWLNGYHKLVYSKLAPLLNETENKWLKEKTNEI